MRDGSTAVCTRGDLEGVSFVGKDVCLLWDALVDVGDVGGLHCDVALWNVGG